ncbi:MAG: DUF2933 domain-containing protein [Nitrospiraceae bacterium]|nr:DUF2933 domain-containing protein [Nitrospiraceae bacterium]
MEHKHESDNDGAMKSKANIALIIFLLIGAVFLLTEHRAHLYGWLPYWWPYVLLLACPLIHLFMHGGHGHGGHGSSEASNETNKEKEDGSHH